VSTQLIKGAGAALLTGRGAFAHSRAPRSRRTRDRLTTPARLLLLGTIAAAVAVAILAIHRDPGTTKDYVTFAVLALGAAIAQLFVVQTPRNQSYHLAIVFVVAAALLLPLRLIVLLCLVQHLPEWLRERYRWYIQTFNIANYTLDVVAAAVAARAVADLPLGSARTVIAGVAACLVFVAVNHTLLTVILWSARGHRPAESGLFSFESISTDVALAALGVGMAVAWDANAWSLPLAAAPLVLIHRALSIPQLKAESRRDPKTGLYNARHLEAALNEELERATRFGRPFSVILADLDLLREINNRWGHLAGDAVLRGIAQIFGEQLRPYDVATRFGGEEFALLLPETDLEEASAIAERIRSAVSDGTFTVTGTNTAVHATVSLGVACYPADAASGDALLHAADVALYQAKAAGRNRVAGAPSNSEHGHLPPAAGAAARLSHARNAEAAPIELGRRRAAEHWPSADDARGEERPAASKQRAADRYVAFLIAAVAVGAAAMLLLTLPDLLDTLRTGPLVLAGFALLALTLELGSVDLHGSGAESVSAIGLLATGFVLGAPDAMGIAILAASVQWVRRRGLVHRAVFNAANFALAAGSASLLYPLIGGHSDMAAVGVLAATAAALTYKAVNTGLLCLAMSLAESSPFRAIWAERFRWASFHYLAFGPLAFASALAYERMGFVGLAAFSLPPALLTLSIRQYLDRTRASVEEVRRVNAQLETTNQRLEKANAGLEAANRELSESGDRVRRTHLATIAALSRSIEVKDHYTGGHTERVSTIAVALAERFGYLGDELEAVEIGALLHDIGKIGVPEAILRKPAPLTDEEWEIIRKHPLVSDYILAEVDLHPIVRQIVRWSHERMDGGGYPDGLAGEEIPLPARIVLVADALDAMTSDRAYRPARGLVEAMDELRTNSGTQFCPRVLETLDAVYREAPHALGADHAAAAA
jgi:diguanylate cyclase (GGDEF)-like protein